MTVSNNADASTARGSIPLGDAVLVTRANRVATITMNRPANRNALSTELVAGLAAALREVSADPDVHVVVLTGAGPVFCAGADLKERRAAGVAPSDVAPAHLRSGEDDESGTASTAPPEFVSIFQTIQEMPKVVVAKLNGSAMAGGLGLMCACDLSIAPLSAKFGFTEVRIGVTPAIISVVCLPKMKASDAAELFLTGERFDAAHAQRVGLLNYAVPDDEIESRTDELVGKLRLGGPNALAATKGVLRRVPQISDRDAAFREMAILSGSLFGSDEGREGMAAFAEKRSPRWV